MYISATCHIGATEYKSWIILDENCTLEQELQFTNILSNAVSLLKAAYLVVLFTVQKTKKNGDAEALWGFRLPFI